MNRITLSIVLCCAMFGVSVSGVWAQATPDANSAKQARDFLLSDDFFDDFYGTDAVDLYHFTPERQTIELPFKSKPDLTRGTFDAPLKMDCSQFDAFEAIADVDDPKALGAYTLYFHSKSGWYSFSGQSKRDENGRLTIVFNAQDFRIEDEPAGLDQVDSFRIAIWRGGEVDSKVTLRSLRASRLSFAVLDVDDEGGENSSFTSSMFQLLNRCGVKAGRVVASTATAESLKRYPAVFLPIAGKISDETVDALCNYVDAGGFLFACYNVPEKLLAKLGVKVDGYIRCSDAGLDLASMKFDPNATQVALEHGYEFPSEIMQKSWNFYRVSTIPNWKSDRKSSIWNDEQARVLANWRLTNGETTQYPALVASPNGVYCSHIFMNDDLVARRTFLETLVASTQSNVAKNFAHTEWTSIFNVGVAPDDNVRQARQETLNFIEKELKTKGWTLADAAQFLNVDSTDIIDVVKIKRFVADVVAIRNKRVEEYCKTRESRENEGRLWWEHSGCGIYPGDWDRTMKELSAAGITGVIPNMLWGGNAYYKSSVLPIDTKVEKYGDQIEMAVAAGKKYGVEVHAWMVCFNASNSTKEFIDKMRAEGRLQRTLDGEEKPWLCPSHPANRALQLAALEEVATKYDVDGVHFDYIRFPDDKTCYCDGCKERFFQAYKEKTGVTLTNFPDCVLRDGEVKTAFQEWRCDQITALVRAVHDSLKAKRPDIKLSAAVFSGYPGTKRSIGQDWGKWIDEGLLDFVCPMDYTSDPASFATYVQNQLPYTQGKVPLYPGIGMTATGISMSPEEVVLQAELARKHGAQGFTIFNLTKTTADAALPALSSGVTAKKTTAPHSAK